MVISNARPPPLKNILTRARSSAPFLEVFMKSNIFPIDPSMKVYITLLIKDFPISLPPLSIDSEFERIIDITHALVDGNISYYVEFKE